MEYFITAAGIPVHIYESKKDGTAILLLHGYLETLYIWNEFIEMIPSEYRIISIDLPGHGLTGIPSDGFNPQFSNFFLISLLDKLSVASCHILTHTCGFRLAYTFSNSHPERVISIFNISSCSAFTLEEKSFIENMSKSISEGLFSKFVSLYVPKMYHTSNLRACDEKIEETIEICETHDPESLSVFLKGISSFITDDFVCSGINVSCYFLSGDSDLFLSEIHDGFDVITGCGTNSFIEKPLDISRRLLSFLSTMSTKENCH